MDLPEVVREALDDESVAAHVSLGGKDVLLVTPSRTLVYRSEGLLSDETVAEYPHGAERIEVARGRRSSTVTLDYGLDGERELDLPTDRLEDALHPVLAGVLNSAGVTESGEAIKDTFLFNELTVVITSERLVRHVGETVWDGDFEEYGYDAVTDLRFEEGDVATAVILRLETGQERFKVPNDRARAFREGLVDAVLDHHGYETLGAFREARTPDEGEDGAATVDFGDGPDPLTADPPSGGRKDYEDAATESVRDEAAASTDRPVDRVESGDRGAVADSADGEPADPAVDADDGPDDAASSRSADDADRAAPDSASGPVPEASRSPEDRELAAEVAALREAVEEQTAALREQEDRIEQQAERIERQADLFEQLIDELRRGR
ncbi:MAG: PspA/IM30 family protein [Haloferacaceae archaeon]